MNVFSVPNLLSLSRLPILLITIYFIKINQNILVITFLLVAVITDILDGYMARRRGEETILGRILDHLIDKIFFNSISFALYLYRDLPLFFVIILFIRDLVSLFFGYIIWKRGKVIGSNLSGKLAGFSLSLLFIFYLFNLPFKEYLIYISLILLAFASSVYFIVFVIFWIQTREVERAK